MIIAISICFVIGCFTLIFIYYKGNPKDLTSGEILEAISDGFTLTAPYWIILVLLLMITGIYYLIK